MPNNVTVSTLYQLIGTDKCPFILDVRISDDFDDDPRIIPGAIKRDFDIINTLADEFAGNQLVIYCQKGLKISQGTAALLRDRGVQATILEGGQFAWRDAQLPMVTASAIPRMTNESHTIWVTHHRPQIDTLACAWLIKRFIDPKARFLFVEPSQVMNVADRFGATPFDVEDVTLSQKGESCCFDNMIEEFGLASKSKPLTQMSKILRGAHTNRFDLMPESAGFFALSMGLSHLYDDELAQLEAGMLFYDALYLWARDGAGEAPKNTQTKGANPS